MSKTDSCLQVLKNELRVEESEKAQAKLKTELDATKAKGQKEKAELGDSRTSIASSDTEDLSPGNNMDRMRVPGSFSEAIE